MKKFNVGFISKIGIFSALVIVLSLTPIGLIPLGPLRITTVHIPIIAIAILEGKEVGFFVGMSFGIFSFLQHLSGISPLSFIFINPLVSVFPRAMIGFFAGLVYEKTAKLSNMIRLILSSIVGTLTNTIGVLSFAYIFFASRIGSTLKVNPLNFILGIISTNGVGEVVLACMLIPLIVLKLKKANKN